MSTVQLPDINQNKTLLGAAKTSGSKRALYGSSTTSQQQGSHSVQSSRENASIFGNSQSLVALRSLDKYYKTNDVHDILGHEKEYYPQLPATQKMSQEKEVDGNLSSLKKSFNLLRNKSDQREKDIQKLRNEIDKMKNSEETLSLRFEGSASVQQALRCYKIDQEDLHYFGKQAFDTLMSDYNQTKANQEEAEMNMKTYEHMIHRMKKDLIAYQLKANGTEDTLDLGESVLLNAALKQQQIQQKEGKAQQALDHVLKAKEEENKEREAYLENFKKALLEQNELEKQRDERIKHQQEIAEVAANDIRDMNVKKWRKLLLVHTFLNTFLKRKMEGEMKKYSGVEQAFQKIKAATGVHDAGEIVHKFLNRESTYSHLLISIADYEKKISNLKKKNEELKKEEHSLKQEILPFEKTETKSDKLHVDEIYQKYHETSDKAENCRLVESRVYDWMIRTLMKLDRSFEITKTKDQYQKEFPINNLSVLIKQISTVVRDNLVELDKKEEAADVITAQLTAKLSENPDVLRRINRVKPIADQNSLQRSASKDSFDKPSFSVDPASHASENEANDSDFNSDGEKDEEINVRQLRRDAKNESKGRATSSSKTANLSQSKAY